MAKIGRFHTAQFITAAGTQQRSARRGETVAGAAHGLDHPLAGVRLQRDTKAPNMDVDRAFLDVDLIAPY
jgi:hypothetical protein